MKSLTWYREPLVHFFLIGIVMFIVYTLLNPEGFNDQLDRKIIIQPGDLEWMISSWERQRGRAPTLEELTRMVNEHIREEVLYREAISLGLDQNDAIVRRRMAQKMSFMTKGLGEQETPTDEILQAFYFKNRARYETPAMISISHIYFSADKRGEAAKTDAQNVLQQLQSEKNPPKSAPDRGDRFILQYDYKQMTKKDLANQFGENFAESVFGLKSDGWYGPIESNYGQHLVYTSNRTEANLPEFHTQKRRVELDWNHDQKQAAEKKMMAGMLQKYNIEITSEAQSKLNMELVNLGEAE